MKPTFHSCLLKTSLLLIPISLCLSGAAAAQAKGSTEPVRGPVGPRPLEAYSDPVQGDLEVYSATEEVPDGDASRYPHSGYAIYAADGRLFKRVQNHDVAPDDESPQVVALPAGSYTVVAQSERDGTVSTRVVIKGGRRTVLNLEGGRKQDAQTIRIRQAVVAPGGQLIAWHVQRVSKSNEAPGRAR